MDHSQNFNGDKQFNQPPPPAYSAPGQDPYQHAKRMENASAPPPPGIYHQNVIHQPAVVYSQQAFFGPEPVLVTCPNCNKNVMTETQSRTGNLTWLMSFLCCFVDPCCCCIPCCIRNCKDIEHNCPNCKAQLGLFQRMG